MKIIQVKDYDALSERACSFLVERINELENPVLGLATGSTPEGFYKQITSAASTTVYCFLSMRI